MTVTSQDTLKAAARAESALLARHAELQEVLDEWANVLAVAAARGDPVGPPRKLLRAFLADEVLPHARAEERTLYAAGKGDQRTELLVRALTTEHRELASRTERLAAQTEPVAAAAAATAIRSLFAIHVAKENDLLLPALEARGVNLAALLAREDHLAGSR